MSIINWCFWSVFFILLLEWGPSQGTHLLGLSSWPLHSWGPGWCLPPTNVCKMALSDNCIYFSNFSLTVEVRKITYSKYTLSIDCKEIPIQFGTNQCQIEIFAVKKGQMPKILWVSSKSVQVRSWNVRRGNEAITGTMPVNFKDFSCMSDSSWI